MEENQFPQRHCPGKLYWLRAPPDGLTEDYTGRPTSLDPRCSEHKSSVSLQTQVMQISMPGETCLQVLHVFPISYRALGEPLNLSEPQVCVLSRFGPVPLFVTPGTAAHQVPLSVGFSRQEYCGGLPCPPPGDLPNPGMEA